MCGFGCQRDKTEISRARLYSSLMLALGEGAYRSIRDCEAEAMDHGENPSMNMFLTERSCLLLATVSMFGYNGVPKQFVEAACTKESPH